MPPRIALSGAEGNIGKVLRVRLRERGRRLRCGSFAPLDPQVPGEDLVSGDLNDPAVVDRLLAEAAPEVDLARRFNLYQRVERMIVDDAPCVFLGHPKKYALRQRRLGALGSVDAVGVTEVESDDEEGSVAEEKPTKEKE